MTADSLVILSALDPVATAVGARWGTPPATGFQVDGAPVRRLNASTLLLRRPGPHVRDESLDRRLPRELRAARPTVVFVSIHRSEQQVECLTVHPLGNFGASAEIGGRPFSVVPTDPMRMAAALRGLAEGGPASGLRASYEATHHGPYLELPAFFAEIGFGTKPGPSPAAVDLLAAVVADLRPEPTDVVALAVGGGHYAPHFTDLAVRRRWAFGHLVSRHALPGLTAEVARAAWAATPGSTGLVYARAQDAELPALRGLGPRRRDQDAPERSPGTTGDAGRPAFGT
ncbi:MAG TPA: D-aminoacyl-tRNA deacylase [Thermoplasmata archaeon]|nr:D-aminoacyl-tRNA deacylase [Thermoplasmata archaeon]HTW56416.1 D-aminoacyl-tRNA deacylase [Thermoplasmata archaeon]